MKRWWPLAALLFGGCATMRSLFPEPYPYEVTPGAVRVPGPAARAVGIAFGDFMVQLGAQRAAAAQANMDGGAEPDGGSEPTSDEPRPEGRLQDCMDRPDFYDAWYSIDDGGTRYLIEIFPKPEVCAGPRAILYGGGALYEIDAKTFTILKREIGE